MSEIALYAWLPAAVVVTALAVGGYVLIWRQQSSRSRLSQVQPLGASSTRDEQVSVNTLAMWEFEWKSSPSGNTLFQRSSSRRGQEIRAEIWLPTRRAGSSEAALKGNWSTRGKKVLIWRLLWKLETSWCTVRGRAQSDQLSEMFKLLQQMNPDSDLTLADVEGQAKLYVQWWERCICYVDVCWQNSIS